METPEAEKSSSCYNGAKNSQLLSDILEEMNQNVNQMQKLVQQDGSYFMKDAGVGPQESPELIGQMEEFFIGVQSLAKCYDHLKEKLSSIKGLSPVLQLQQGLGNPEFSSEQGSPLLNSDQKIALSASGLQSLDVFYSSGGDSSVSLKASTESYSSSDSESESLELSLSNEVARPANTKGGELTQKHKEVESKVLNFNEAVRMAAVEEEKEECIHEVTVTAGYDELLRRITRSEEELRLSNMKLELSENEVARLKSELKNNESLMSVNEALQGRLELMVKDGEEKDAVIELERKRAAELQGRVSQLEFQFYGSISKVMKIADELEKTEKRSRELYNEQLPDLKQMHGDLFTNFIQEIRNLEQSTLQSGELEGITGWHVTELMALQTEIRQLKKELHGREEHVEVLNKDFDMLKLRYDMMMAEKDELNAKVHSLMAELSSQGLKDKELEENRQLLGAKNAELHERNAKIHMLMAELNSQALQAKELEEHRQLLDAKNAELHELKAKVDSLMAELSSKGLWNKELEENLQQLGVKNAELLAASESSRKVIGQLTTKVEDLQEVVKSLRVLISDSAEEKREAIRQLCYSLDYYRSGYKELCQAFNGHKRPAVMAA